MAAKPIFGYGAKITIGLTPSQALVADIRATQTDANLLVIADMIDELGGDAMDDALSRLTALRLKSLIGSKLKVVLEQEDFSPSIRRSWVAEGAIIKYLNEKEMRIHCNGEPLRSTECVTGSSQFMDPRLI